MPTSEKKRGEEFFVDKNGKKEDAALHEAILADGDEKTATDIGRDVALRLGLSPKAVDRLIPKK
jgi:hypothetical protein